MLAKRGRTCQSRQYRKCADSGLFLRAHNSSRHYDFFLKLLKSLQNRILIWFIVNETSTNLHLAKNSTFYNPSPEFTENCTFWVKLWKAINADISNFWVWNFADQHNFICTTTYQKIKKIEDGHYFDCLVLTENGS